MATVQPPKSGRPSIVALAWAMHEKAQKKAKPAPEAEAAPRKPAAKKAAPGKPAAKRSKRRKGSR